MSDATWKRWLGRVTSVVSFAAIIYSFVTSGTQQPTLLIMLGMFAGLPIVLNLESLIRQPPPPQTPAPTVPERTVEVP